MVRNQMNILSFEGCMHVFGDKRWLDKEAVLSTVSSSVMVHGSEM